MYRCIFFIIVLFLGTSSLSANDEEKAMMNAIQSSGEPWGFSKHEEVKKLLDNGVNPNGQQHGKSALYIACERGESHIAQLLLERGADSAFVDNSGMSPLWRAVTHGRGLVINALLAVNVPLHVVHRDKSTLLHMAAGAGANPDSEVVAKILEKKATDPNVQDKDGRTPLMYAVNVNLATVKLLLAAGADPQKKDRFGKTASDYADESSALEKKQIVVALSALSQKSS